MTTTVGRMRTALTILALGALLGATSACSSSSLGSDDVPAKEREQEVVDVVTEAVPVVQDALGGDQGRSSTGRGGRAPAGSVTGFSGGGTITAPRG